MRKFLSFLVLFCFLLNIPASYATDWTKRRAMGPAIVGDNEIISILKSFNWPLPEKIGSEPYIKDIVDTDFVKITIMSVWPGEKFSDTCISEFKFE